MIEFTDEKLKPKVQIEDGAAFKIVAASVEAKT